MARSDDNTIPRINYFRLVESTTPFVVADDKSMLYGCLTLPKGICTHLFDRPAGEAGKERKTLPGRATVPKPSKPMADKVLAQSHPEATPMSCTSQTSKEQRPANLAALHERLQEIAASTKSPVPAARPVVQGPVIVVRGK